MKAYRFFTVLSAILILTFTAGCGSDGSGSDSGSNGSGNIVPEPPSSIAATEGSGQITISWEAISNATSYNLYYSTTGEVNPPNGTKVTGVTSPYTIRGIANGTTYYAAITSVNGSNESLLSSLVGATASTSASTTAPFIRAQVATWPSPLPRWILLNLQNTVKICTDSTCSTPITDAQVTVNNSVMAYNSNDGQYETVLWHPEAGTQAIYMVTIPSGDGVAAGSYTVLGNQFWTFPTVTTPSLSAIWQHAQSNTVDWTAGFPTGDAEYDVYITDSSGNFYPNSSSPETLPVNSISYTLPADSIPTAGTYTVYVMIATPGFTADTTGGITIPGTASGSGLWMAGVSAGIPVTVQ